MTSVGADLDEATMNALISFLKDNNKLRSNTIATSSFPRRDEESLPLLPPPETFFLCRVFLFRIKLTELYTLLLSLVPPSPE